MYEETLAVVLKNWISASNVMPTMMTRSEDHRSRGKEFFIFTENPKCEREDRKNVYKAQGGLKSRIFLFALFCMRHMNEKAKSWEYGMD
jgi:hypothetical protein